MMKKLRNLLIVMQLIAAAVFCICFVWVWGGIRSRSTPPFGLTQNYVMIHAFSSDENMSSNEKKLFLDGLYGIVRDHPVTILLDDADNMGLGVYDTQVLYEKYPLTQGEYYSVDDFAWNNPSILVQEDSYIQRAIEENIQIKGVSNDIQGVYDVSHPLATCDHQFVYNLFTDTYINATYYIDSPDPGMANAIIELMREYHFQYSIMGSGKQRAGWGLILSIMKKPLFLLMAAGIVIMLVSYFILSFNIFNNMKKAFSIHLRFGATRMRLFRVLLKRLHIPIVLSAAVGVLAYNVADAMIGGPGMPTWSVLAVFVLHAASTYAVLFISYVFSLRFIRKGGEYIV